MTAEENLAALKARLAAIPGITPTQMDVLTSDVLLTHIMPLMTAFVTENVTQTQAVKDKTSEKLRTLAEKIIVAPKGPQDINDFVKDVANGIFNADWIEKEVMEISDHWFWGPIMAILVGAVHVMTTVTSYVSVSSERTRQIANQDIRPYLLDLPSLVEEYFRHPQNYAWVLEQMRKMGIDDKKITVFLDNQKSLLGIGELRTLYNREQINIEELHDRLKKIRVDPNDFNHMQTLFKQYPGVSDFVMFSVREAYDSAFVSDAGLGGDMPTEFIDDCRKIGLPEEYARKFWYSHWVPPSPRQSYEMLHRGLIDEEELNRLLRINDIMPNYREKMVQIAYTVPGRVDIRRFYQDGVIDYEKMYSMYLDAGQSPENAELMSEWTELHYGEERRQRSRTDIIKLYRLKSINRIQSVTGIQDLGYSEEIASEYVTREDLEQAEKKKAAKLKLQRKGFINFVYDEQQVRNYMTAIGITSGVAADLIEEWKIDRDSKIRFLPLKEVEKMYGGGIMSDTEVKDDLSIQGYNNVDIDRLIALWSTSDG